MLLVAKKISNFLQSRPIFVVSFWALSSFTFFLLAASFEIVKNQIFENEKISNSTNLENHINHNHHAEVYRDPRLLVPFIVLPALCLLIFSRSIPIIFSLSLSTFLSLCILSFFSKLNHLFNTDPSYLVIVVHVTTANAIFLRRCWDKYRRGPCSSTIFRLLLATIDKSLPLLIATSSCAALIPLVSVIISPGLTIIPSVTIFLLCLLQNVCTLSSILVVLLIRNTYNWCIPSVRTNFARPIQAFIEEKLVYFAHLMCRIGKILLASHVKIPVVFAYIILILAYLCLMLLRIFEFVNISFKLRGGFECSFFNCFAMHSLILLLCLFIVPPVFFCAMNRLQINTFISLVGFTFNLIVFEIVREFFLDDAPISSIEYVIASMIPADGALRYCSVYRFSRKKNHQQKVLDVTDTLFAQITLATLCSTCAILFLYFYMNRQPFLFLIFVILITNWITSVVFYPSAITLIGPFQFSKRRRGSNLSETRSLNTERFSFLENPDYSTKNYSTTKYHDPNNQKRSYNVLITDSRRASMPVSVQKISVSNSNAPIFKKKSWATHGCFSVDGVITMSPREALQMMRKEDSITSDNILIKELALI